MIDGWRDTMILLTAVGCGLVGGVFFAFSAFVMPALASLPAPGGISAMQAINVFAPRPALGTALVLPAIGSAVLSLAAVTGRGDGHGALPIAGGLIYLIGTLGVTIAFNVPLNDTLAATEPNGETGAAVWRTYLTEWVRWNHLRTVSSVAASALFILALR